MFLTRDLDNIPVNHSLAMITRKKVSQVETLRRVPQANRLIVFLQILLFL